MLVKAGFSEGLLTQLQNESKVSREDVGMLSSNSLNRAFARLWGLPGRSATVTDSRAVPDMDRHSVRVGEP